MGQWDVPFGMKDLETFRFLYLVAVKGGKAQNPLFPYVSRLNVSC